MAQNDMLLVTSDEVPGRKVVEVLGLVRGSSVRARAVGRDIQAGIRSLVGGRVGVYVELLAETRKEAESDMVKAAQEMGANAIVAVRLATSQVMGDAAEVLTYGTAVRLE